MRQYPTGRAYHARQRGCQPELGATKSGRQSTVQLFDLPLRQATDNVRRSQKRDKSALRTTCSSDAKARHARAHHIIAQTQRESGAPRARPTTPLRHAVPHKSTRAVEIAALHATTRLTCHPALVRSADIALTRRAQRAPTCADDQKRPRSSARPPALSSNQLRRALTARLIILASQPGRQSTWAWGINGPSGQVQYQIGSPP